MSSRLSGAWFKLVTSRGDDLGVLMMPEDIARYLEKESPAWTGQDFPLMPTASFNPNSMNEIAPVGTRTYHIVRAQYPHEHAIFLVGISPEKLSQRPGFAFLPSAHYMRCTHTDIRTGEPTLPPKAEEAKPEPSGLHLEAARAVTLEPWGAKSL